MPSYFGLSIRFLDPAFHGRRDGGEPEWPPSPLRLFQSLVAAAGALRRAQALAPALKWLEQQGAPILVAPAAVTGSGYRLSVPNNAMDVVARAWCRGNYSNSGDADPKRHRTMKTVRPRYMLDGDAVHYLWHLPDPFTDEVRGYVEALSALARSVVALGWGVDMVVGHGEIMGGEQADALRGERWMPESMATSDGLRVPVQGTLDAVIQRHERFLKRLEGGAFTAPPPLSVYHMVEYRRSIDPRSRPVAIFSLLRPDASGFQAFDTVRSALTVAGMMRHTVRLAAESAGWPDSRVNKFILGHAESADGDEHVPVGPQRFAYLPLPSIEPRGEGKARVVGSVRRVTLTTFAGDGQAEITWARRNLSGQELVDQKRKQPVALLSLIPETEKVVRYYTERAASWATVTPLVLPGYDDSAHYRRRLKRGTSADEQKQLLARLDRRVDGLLRKAITQGGFSTVLADNAQLEWRKVGFWPGTDLANRYGVPDHLRRFPRFHVRLHWRDADKRPVQVPGPVCLGGGRFYGLGLFAREED
jgi:CRISPR-associated protein Csb2